MNPTLLEFDRKAREAGRLFVDRTVAVGAVTQADGFAESPSTSCSWGCAVRQQRAPQYRPGSFSSH